MTIESTSEAAAYHHVWFVVGLILTIVLTASLCVPATALVSCPVLLLLAMVCHDKEHCQFCK